MRSWNSGGKAPVSTKEATWPTFIAAPFMFPSTSKICSAASSWRRSAAAFLPSSSRVRSAARPAYERAAWPPARRPTLAARRMRPFGIESSVIPQLYGWASDAVRDLQRRGGRPGGRQGAAGGGSRDPRRAGGERPFLGGGGGGGRGVGGGGWGG